MKIINCGSLNVDYVYRLDHIVKPGETLASSEMQVNPGGKGSNQSVALKRAGADVWHAGLLGEDTAWMRERLEREGVDVRHVLISKEIHGGHAIIQVEKTGKNSIIVLPAANFRITEEDADRVLDQFGAGDWIVLQNESSSLAHIIRRAHEKGMKVVLNPSPFNERIPACDLDAVDYLFVNEVEAAQISGLPESFGFDTILGALQGQFPEMNILMTLGHRGSCFAGADGSYYECGPYRVNAVDTTGAGDCFTGYFLACLTAGKTVPESLKTASAASGISVSRPGAGPSIPRREEVEAVDLGSIAERFER